jgi:hypothetical protein
VSWWWRRATNIIEQMLAGALRAGLNSAAMAALRVERVVRLNCHARQLRVPPSMRSWAVG